jgi:hypothetical protein
MAHKSRPSFEADEDLAGVMMGRGPCTWLLLALLGLVLVYPYIETGAFGRILLGILFSLVLVGGAHAIGQNKRLLIPRIGLAALGIALQWTAILSGARLATQFAAITYATFLAIAIAEVLRYIMKRGPITADKLHGALAGYIMMAVLWAFIYALIESVRPGSFAQAIPLSEPGAFFRFLYFSFATLTTTGFGDVTPATDQARSVVMIEEFAGVFFVGVLIARLAGLYPPTQNR